MLLVFKNHLELIVLYIGSFIITKGIVIENFFNTSMLDYKVNAAFEEKLSQVELLKITSNS